MKFPKQSLTLLPHMHPSIRISPFIPSEWTKLIQNTSSSNKSKVNQPQFWLNNAKENYLFDSGRTALLACLKHLSLKRNDEVLIITTTNGPYISGCVTKTIEKVCQWKRKRSNKTRLVLVIHEFGFPCPYNSYKKYQSAGIPVLEDCAYAMGSRIEGAPHIGMYGDYAIYSFPKYLPSPFGGLLASRHKIQKAGLNLELGNTAQILLMKSINFPISQFKKWNHARQNNWRFFSKRLPKSKFRSYFKISSNIVPGVYLCKVPKDFKGEKLKKRLNASGVESTQYYNQGGFYFPVHQFLSDYEKQYIIHHFLNNKH